MAGFGRHTPCEELRHGRCGIILVLASGAADVAQRETRGAQGCNRTSAASDIIGWPSGATMHLLGWAERSKLTHGRSPRTNPRKRRRAAAASATSSAAPAGSQLTSRACLSLCRYAAENINDASLADFCESYSGYRDLNRLDEWSSPAFYPRFFDEQLGSAVGAIDYVRGSRS
jgi:hypothetical protein